QARQRLLVFNSNSGFLVGRKESPDTHQTFLQQILVELGITNVSLKEFESDKLDDLSAYISEARPEAIWVLGGDGTIKTLSALALELDVPLGVLPGGTMNLMARDLGISLDLQEALLQLDRGEIGFIDVARVNGDPFFCVSNLGLAIHMTRKRERLRLASPWKRWPLMGWYLIQYLLRYPAMTIEMQVNGQLTSLRTRAAFISNNPLAGDSFLIPRREDLCTGNLGIYIVRGDSFWTLPRVALEALLGDWKADRDIEVFRAPAVCIRIRGRRYFHVMNDGELTRFKGPLLYKIESSTLKVVRPPRPQGGDGK
ncbi:MAG: diacylglycerol/lipid kinase family protein, partial [Oceanobacter sp.]